MSPDQAEWRAEDVEGAGLQVAGRPAQAFWLLLRPAFRRVLLEPHRRTGAGTVGWTWTDSRTPSAPGGADLRDLRARMRGALDEFAAELTWRDEGAGEGRPSELHQVMAAMVRDLIEAGDDRLAAHAVRTPSGWMIRSWGFSRPAKAVCAGAGEEPREAMEADAPGEELLVAARRRKRGLGPWIIGAVALVAVAGGGWLWLGRGSTPPPLVSARESPVATRSPDNTSDHTPTQPERIRPKAEALSSGGGGGAGLGGGLSIEHLGLAQAGAGLHPAKLSSDRGGFGARGMPAGGASGLTPATGATGASSLETAALSSAAASAGAVGAGNFAEAPDAVDGAASTTGPERALVVPGQMAGLSDPGSGAGAPPGAPANTSGGAGAGGDQLTSLDQQTGAQASAGVLASAHPPSTATPAPPLPAAKRAAVLTPAPVTVIAMPVEAGASPTPSGGSSTSQPADPAMADAPPRKSTEDKKTAPAPAKKASSDLEQDAEENRTEIMASTRGLEEATALKLGLRRAVAKSKNPHANASDPAGATDDAKTSQADEGTRQAGDHESKKTERASRSVTKEGEAISNQETASGQTVAVDEPSKRVPHANTVSCKIGKWRIHPGFDVALPTWPAQREADQALETARDRAWSKAQAARPAVFRAPVTRAGWSVRLSPAAMRPGAPVWRDTVTGVLLTRGVVEGETARLSWEGLVPATRLDARLVAADGRELARLTVLPYERSVTVISAVEVVESAPWLSVELSEKGAVGVATWRSPAGNGADARWEISRTANAIEVVCYAKAANPRKAMNGAIELVHVASGWAMTCGITDTSSELNNL